MFSRSTYVYVQETTYTQNSYARGSETEQKSKTFTMQNLLFIKNKTTWGYDKKKKGSGTKIIQPHFH